MAFAALKWNVSRHALRVETAMASTLAMPSVDSIQAMMRTLPGTRPRAHR